MKRSILIVAFVVVALTVFGVGVAFAQGGPNGGFGGMMQNGQGTLHSYMVSAFAEKLDLTVEQVNTRLTAGERMYDIALAEGVTSEEFPTFMTEVRTNALAAAVKDGVITQDQADWMLARGFGRGGTGNGTCMGTGPQAGRGRGMMGPNGGWVNP